MKKNIVALTLLMALSATAQAEMINSENLLTIKGNVTVGGCAFKDRMINDQQLTMTLDEKTVGDIFANQDVVLSSIEGGDNATLVCPASITNVNLALKPNAGDVINGNILKNTSSAGNDAAKGIGFKLKVAFGDDLTPSTEWVNFQSHNFDAVPDANSGEIAINFGANYALTGTLHDADAGQVEAKVPFTISYL